jgi:hypothetical protein
MVAAKLVFASVICTTLMGAAPLLAAERKTEFVGSQSCKSCHPQEFKSWKASYHSKIVMNKKGGILKEAVTKWGTDGRNPGPTSANATNTPAKLDDVLLVVGSRWKQRYLVKNDQTGGLQFLNKQYNRLTCEWENYGNNNDWNSSCGTCHTTGYRIIEVEQGTGKTLKDEWSELSVGCEACHGPGANHVKAAAIDKRRTIFNPAGLKIDAQSKVCGYCHSRVENSVYKTPQGNPREDLPAPVLGEAGKAGDDWTKWYPEQVIIPGVQAKHPFDAEYKGDLKGLFKTDEFAKANGIYEEGKHHEEYQGFIQSKHFQSGQLSCITCHSPHAGNGKLKKVPSGACIKCHEASYTVERYMPNTGKTAENLFVRSHTFGKNPRKGGKGAADMDAPVLYE